MINNIKLFKKQKEIVARGLSSLEINGCYGFFDEVRTGKTLMVLDLIYKINPYPQKVLIICPNNLLIKWKLEIQQWLKEDALIINHQKDYFNINFREHLFYLVGIELFSIHHLKFKFAFEKTYFQMVILDEAHYIKNYRSKRAKAVFKVTKDFYHKIALTGTPAPHSAVDIFSILKFLKPKMFSSYWKFVEKYCMIETIKLGFKNIKKVIGLDKDNKRELQEILYNLSSKSKRKDHNFYFSNIKEKIVNIKSTSDQQYWYNEVKENEEIVLPNGDEINFFNGAPHLTLLNSIIQIGFMPENYGIKGNIIGWLEHLFKSNEKVIIVSKSTKYLMILNEYFYKYKCLTYTGKDTTKQKHQKLEQFKNTDIQVLFANYLALKEGLNLYQIHNIVFLDLPWNPAVFEQCKNRITPPVSANKKQMKTEKIVYIVKNDLPICQWLFQLVKEKKSIIKEINNYNIKEIM